MIYCTHRRYFMARIATSYPLVDTRLVRNCALGRVTQYSRDVSDRTDKLRRTGSSACAEDDSGGSVATSTVIASAATRIDRAPHSRSGCLIARKQPASTRW
jgi:hypothetical protein